MAGPQGGAGAPRPKVAAPRRRRERDTCALDHRSILEHSGATTATFRSCPGVLTEAGAISFSVLQNGTDIVLELHEKGHNLVYIRSIHDTYDNDRTH